MGFKTIKCLLYFLTIRFLDYDFFNKRKIDEPTRRKRNQKYYNVKAKKGAGAQHNYTIIKWAK